MSNKHLFLLAVCTLFASLSRAQDSLATHVTYDLMTEASVGTGDYTAFQLSANRHHVLSTRANTAYVRGAVHVDHPLSSQFTLSATVDALASVHADHKAYLQQCYANLSYQSFFLEVGSREIAPILRHSQLSSGTLMKGTNAKPIPQVHIGTNGFWTVPFTKGWLQACFDVGYGKFLDSNYREDQFNLGGLINQQYATGSLYHQKHLYFRSNPSKPIFVIAGIEHVVQFCGTGYRRSDSGLSMSEKPANLKAFWEVILPVGDTQYFEHEATEDWVYGNHLGSMTLQVGWNINANHLLQVYLDNPFEDGSGIRKGNGWDGLWGVQYTNKSPGRQAVREVVVEYLQTTNQSGPLHFDGADYPEPIRSQISDLVVGDDNYYNHSFYDSYTHYGMTPGHPLLTSPIYNQDGHTAFRDNRVKAWHIGIQGECTGRLSYIFKGSYREGLGIYAIPLTPKHHSFDALLQGSYRFGSWQFSAAYAITQGNILGDCSTFDIKIGYHGKIL